MTDFNIKYIGYDELDTDKWDACLEKASNALVYAQSWYLDKVASPWDALVLGDYKYIMPLTKRSKLGVGYLCQPLNCQQLGIFPAPNKEIIQAFYQELTRHFKFGQIHLNTSNIPSSDMFVEVRYNLLLNLHEPYWDIAARFSQHTNRKLRKATINKLNFVSGLSMQQYLDFKLENSAVKLNKADVWRLRNLLAFSLSRNLGEVYGIYDSGNQLCAAAFFVRYQKRVTFVNAVTNEEGKRLSAMYFLIDQFIMTHANKEYVLDFEGSMIDGVARLYKGFGASPETYYYLSWNQLPFWAKWLKK